MTLEYVAARARRSGRGDAKRLIALGDLQGNRKMTRLMAMRRQVGEGVRGLQRFMPPSALKLRLLWDMNWSRGYYGEIYSS
jgi:hypothetical protein